MSGYTISNNLTTTYITCNLFNLNILCVLLCIVSSVVLHILYCFQGVVSFVLLYVLCVLLGIPYDIYLQFVYLMFQFL